MQAPPSHECNFSHIFDSLCVQNHVETLVKNILQLQSSIRTLVSSYQTVCQLESQQLLIKALNSFIPIKEQTNRTVSKLSDLRNKKCVFLKENCSQLQEFCHRIKTMIGSYKERKILFDDNLVSVINTVKSNFKHFLKIYFQKKRVVMLERLISNFDDVKKMECNQRVDAYRKIMIKRKCTIKRFLQSKQCLKLAHLRVKKIPYNCLEHLKETKLKIQKFYTQILKLNIACSPSKNMEKNNKSTIILYNEIFNIVRKTSQMQKELCYCLKKIIRCNRLLNNKVNKLIPTHHLICH